MIYNDGIFLKDKYLKTLFIIVANNEINQIYPLAFDMRHKEKTKSWT